MHRWNGIDLHIFGLIHFFIESIVYELQEFSRPWVYDLKWLKTCWFNDVAQKRFGLSHALHTATSLSCLVITMTDFYTMGLRGFFFSESLIRITVFLGSVQMPRCKTTWGRLVVRGGRCCTSSVVGVRLQGSGMVNFICYYLTSICLHLQTNEVVLKAIIPDRGGVVGWWAVGVWSA